MQEEEIRRAAEARRKREEAEATRWMHTFSVEAAGEEALSQEQGQVCVWAAPGMSVWMHAAAVGVRWRA